MGGVDLSCDGVAGLEAEALIVFAGKTIDQRPRGYTSIDSYDDRVGIIDLVFLPWSALNWVHAPQYFATIKSFRWLV